MGGVICAHAITTAREMQPTALQYVAKKLFISPICSNSMCKISDFFNTTYCK